MKGIKNFYVIEVNYKLNITIRGREIWIDLKVKLLILLAGHLV